VAETRDGERVTYPAPDADHQFSKLSEAIRAVREPVPVLCGPEAARAQTLCANGVHESVETVGHVPESLGDDLRLCFDTWRLPSEAGLDWGVAGRRVDLLDYTQFPSPEAELAG
jgi:hypothetical protein